MILKKDGGEPKPIRKLDNRWAPRQATAQPTEPAPVLLQRQKVSYEDFNNGSKDKTKLEIAQKDAQKKTENYFDLQKKDARDKKKRREPTEKSGKNDEGKREKSRKSQVGQKDEGAPVRDAKGLELGGQPKMDSPKPEPIVGSPRNQKKKKPQKEKTLGGGPDKNIDGEPREKSDKKTPKRNRKKSEKKAEPMPEPINLADLEGDATKPSPPETLPLRTDVPDS